jgi:AcrR family transcriptional regulator
MALSRQPALRPPRDRRARRALRAGRPRRGTPEATRTRLVAAAADVFNRDGYHGTDSNRIARAAGYAAGTFYKHFADKREILLAAYEAWVGVEWEAVANELAGGGGREEIAARIVEWVLRHHLRWRGLRASLAALVAEDAGARRFHREQRRRQLRLLRALRRNAGAAPRSAETDAVLLFTLERVCDAVATGEAGELGLRHPAVVRLLRTAVVEAIG